MSLFYIVDGYNVIKSSPLFYSKKLREGREAFFSFLEHHRPHGSPKNRLVVVFDSSIDVWGFKENYSFEIIYSLGTSADEEIKKLVLRSDNVKNTIVVTNDRDLSRSVRSSGAKIMSTVVFLNKKNPPRQKNELLKNKREFLEKAELNIVEREKITEELRQLWLKKKSY